ncbi:2-oxoglutarate oxidoreductase, partial [bacterium]
MKTVFTRPQSLVDRPFHFCPGCHHGLVHRLVAEAIDKFGVREDTIGAASVGCSVFMYDYFDIDVVESPHGRSPAVATGVKRANPDKFVILYQGDGDLAAIGTAEIIHAANRGENITVIFANNTVYGMTGGQMAPTTMLGQRTTTSPYGREFSQDGYPIKITEMLSQ